MTDKDKGYSIIEVLITLLIVSLILSAAYFTYISIFKSVKGESETVELQMERIVGLELLRLDLEHTGYGIGKPLTIADEYRILEKIDMTPVPGLMIRSTLNNTNNATIGWVLCNNNEGNDPIKMELEAGNENLVFVDNEGFIVGSVTDGLCPTNGILIGFPYDPASTGCNGTCTEILYYLSNTNLPKHCHSGTYNLLRKVNNAAGGNPLLSCVADFRFTVDLDTDDNNIVDLRDQPLDNTISANDLRLQLKRINVYLLIQEGGFNPDYRFKNYQSDSKGNYIAVDGQKLYLPDSSDFIYYRWKVVKISVKPMSIIK
ncbi:pilus assembly FimT family protein [Persephonella sp.]